MKKLFDKYIAQSSKGQMLALGGIFVVVVIIGAIVGPLLLPGDTETTVRFGYDWLWGLMNCIDAGYVGDTLQSSAKIAESGDVVSPPGWWVIVISVLFWAFGITLASFFTGAVTNFLDARREDILSGNVDYKFSKNYVLIVGVDFQVKNLVKSLLGRHPSSGIVVLTDGVINDIYDDLNNELLDTDARRLYIMRKDLCSEASYAKFHLHGAKEIFVIGDALSSGRDGMSLKALDMISQKMTAEKDCCALKPIKAYLHIEDTIFYSQVRAMEIPADSNDDLDLEIYNYYESWACKCWSQKDATDGKDKYLQLRHKEGSTRAELFVIGAGRMGRTMVNFAIPLMNYGADGKDSRITIFDADILKKGFLADQETLQSLPEVEVRYEAIYGCSDEANDIMLQAAEREDTSVSIVIAISDPAMALRAHAELSNRLRRKNISVLIWQAVSSETCMDKKYLKLGGPDAKADRTNVCYFGMTDTLPWMESERFNYGMAVNYFYECWFPYDKDYPKSPNVAEADFLAKAKKMWNALNPGKSRTDDVEAGEKWAKTPRWKKWSSVNSGDTFREKSQLFDGLSANEAAEKVLKAEHNRWWTEKLLTGWLPDTSGVVNDDSNADKKNMLHGDMIPFEQLSEVVKDKDKIHIAAMAACGFI
jgi:hypothetical protein